ncbi:hypothetical protein BC628DRAFT_1360174 [Trametes gibbosa]|nr:hypothetical protein BC628DRAFT_1360174 [Trametes gibbosa]
MLRRKFHIRFTLLHLDSGRLQLDERRPGRNARPATLRKPQQHRAHLSVPPALRLLPIRDAHFAPHVHQRRPVGLLPEDVARYKRRGVYNAWSTAAGTHQGAVGADAGEARLRSREQGRNGAEHGNDRVPHGLGGLHALPRVVASMQLPPSRARCISAFRGGGRSGLQGLEFEARGGTIGGDSQGPEDLWVECLPEDACFLYRLQHATLLFRQLGQRSDDVRGIRERTTSQRRTRSRVVASSPWQRFPGRSVLQVVQGPIYFKRLQGNYAQHMRAHSHSVPASPEQLFISPTIGTDMHTHREGRAISSRLSSLLIQAFGRPSRRRIMSCTSGALNLWCNSELAIEPGPSGNSDGTLANERVDVVVNQALSTDETREGFARRMERLEADEDD